MKMRKILSFVLVLSLVLGSFSMAFAADSTTGLSDIAGNANEDAIQVNNELGIINGFPDGTFLPEKAVNRAEFAAMITRALAVPESALAGYTSTTFKDTAGYGWAVPYLAFAQSKGIMIGDGMGNVMPGRTINVNEAMTMVLRAVGYVNHSAELVGTWPSNYVTVAQNLKLYEDVAATMTVDRANAAQIIYNALTVQKVSVNADGETKYLTLSGTTTPAVLLNTGLDCTVDTGVVLGSAGYSYDDALFNITTKLGAYGDAYVNSDNEVVAFTVKGTALTGKLNGSYFKANGTDYTFVSPVTNASPAATIVNGALPTTMTITAAQAASQDANVTIYVDLSGKNIKSLYSTVVWGNPTGKVVAASDLTGIKDGELLTVDFDLDDNDNIKTDSFQLVGAKSLSDIKADDVVYVYGDPIRKVAVGTETVTGKITQLGTRTATIDGKAYKFYNFADAEPSGAATFTGITVGSDAELTLDAYGFVYDVDTTGTANNYAVVKAFDANTTATLLPPAAKLYTSDDATKIYDLAEGTDLTLVGTSTGMTKTSLTPGAIVGYALDKDGVVNKLNLTVVSGSAAAYLESATILNYNSATIRVDSNAVVFTKVDGQETYDITSIDSVETGSSNDLKVDGTFQYIYDASTSKVVAMLINNSQADKSTDDVYAVVNDIYAALDSNDDEVQRIVGFANGAAFDVKTVSGTVVIEGVTAEAFSFTLDTNGNIKSVNNPVTSVSATTVSGIDSTTIKLGNMWYALADDVVVYEAKIKTDGTYGVDEYVVSSINSIRSASNYYARIYDMDNSSGNSGYEVVVWFKY